MSSNHARVTIGEEGSGKPPHKVHLPRKDSEPCLWFLLPSKSRMQRSFLACLRGCHCKGDSASILHLAIYCDNMNLTLFLV